MSERPNPLDAGLIKGGLFTVHCRYCPAKREFPTLNRKSSTERAARRAGWRKSRTAGWLCPTCGEHVR